MTILFTLLVLALLGRIAHNAWYYWYGPGYRPWRAPAARAPPPVRAPRLTFQEALARHARQTRRAKRRRRPP